MISWPTHGFSIRCLRFTNSVAAAHARLASGWLARLCREGVEPSGPIRKVSVLHSIPLSRAYPDASWSHCRRYFVNAVKLNKQDGSSIRAVELINELFAIDAQARTENMDHAARQALRHEKAPPLLAQIRTHILEMSKTVLPKSAAGQACSYALTIWNRLIRFLDYPELELSNNLAENSMRPIALGRKNWIHIGSEQAGPRVAAIISVIESCRRLKIPVRDYLADILPGLANTPLQHTAELTPAAWAAKISPMRLV